MIHLDATTRSLQIKLAGAVSTYHLPVLVSYSEYDDAAGTLTLAANETQTNNTTAVSILAAPASGKTRSVDHVNVYNKDTASATVTVQFDDGGTARELVKATLASGETLQYVRDRGWLQLGASVPVTGTVAATQSGTWTTQSAQSGTWTVQAAQSGSWTVAATQSGSWSVSVLGTVTVDSELTTADLDTGAGTDTRAVVGLVYASNGGAVTVSASNPLPVSAAQSGSWTVAASQSGTWIVGVSGTVAVSQSGGWSVSQTGTWTVQAQQSGSWSVSVSGTVTVDTELTTADLDTGVGTDTRAVVGLVYASSGGATLVSANAPLPVTAMQSGSWSVSQTGAWSVSVTGDVDTELPAAAALADGASNPTTPLVGSCQMRWNGATWDREQATQEGTLLASAARTSDTTSADQTNYTARGVMVYVRVSAGTPNLSVYIQLEDPISGLYANANATPTAITATGLYCYELSPGGTVAGQQVYQRTGGHLPRTWRIYVVHNNANSITYSVAYCYLV